MMENWHSYACNDCDSVFDVLGILHVEEGHFRCPDCLGWNTEPLEMDEKILERA